MPKTSLRTFLDKNLSSVMKTLGASDKELTLYDLEDSSIYEPVPDNADPFTVYLLQSLALFTSQKNQSALGDELALWRKQLIGKSRDRRLEDNLSDLGFKDVISPLPGTRGGGIKANLGRIFTENNIDSISSSYIEKIYHDLNIVEKLLYMAEPVSFKSFESFSANLSISPALVTEETKRKWYENEKNEFFSRRTPVLLEYFPAMLDAFPENMFSKEIRKRIFNALLPRVKEADNFVLLNEIFGRISESQQQQFADNINLKQCLLKTKGDDLKPEDMQNIIRLFLKYFNMKIIPDTEKSEYLHDIVGALLESTRSKQHYEIILSQLKASNIYNSYQTEMQPLITKYDEILKAIEHLPNKVQNTHNVIWNLAKTKGSAEEIIAAINAYQKKIEEPILNPMNFLWTLASRNTVPSNSSSISMPNLTEEENQKNNLIAQLFRKS